MYPTAPNRKQHDVDPRGRWDVPAYAIAGVSDTGNWPDSPAKTEVGEAELLRLKADLKRDTGICSKTGKRTHSEGNPLLAKHWLTVKPIDYHRAREYALRWLTEHESDTQLIHHAETEDEHATNA
jgi:hypothetical protein